MSDLPKRLRIKAGVMNMGGRIAWGSDTALMEEAASLIEQQQAEIATLTNQVTVLKDKCGEPESYKCVVYDMNTAEGKIRQSLIKMGWTPPQGEQQ